MSNGKENYTILDIQKSPSLNSHNMYNYLTKLIASTNNTSNYMLCRINDLDKPEVSLMDAYSNIFREYKEKIQKLVEKDDYINYAKSLGVNDIYLIVTLAQKNSYSSKDIDSVLPFYTLTQEQTENMGILTNLTNLWFLSLSNPDKEFLTNRFKNTTIYVIGKPPETTSVNELMTTGYVTYSQTENNVSSKSNFTSWKESLYCLNSTKTAINCKTKITVDDLLFLSKLDKLQLLLLNSVPKEIENKTLKELFTL